jgi:hypothetical protein
MAPLRPEDLVGQRSTDPQVSQFLSQIKGKRDIDSFAGMDIFDYPEDGFAIYFDEAQRVVSMFFHGPGHEDHDKYNGLLPHDLSFATGRAEANQKLGTPAATGKEKASGSPWDRFDFPGHSVHLKYSADLKNIQLITLMSPSMARGEI